MKDIKRKASLEKIAKAAEVGIDVTTRAKQNVSKIKKRVQENTQNTQASSSEYGSEKLQSGTETVITEAGHLVVHTTKTVYRSTKKPDVPITNNEVPSQSGNANNAPVPTQNVHTAPPQEAPSSASKPAENTSSPRTAGRSVKKAQRTIKIAKETIHRFDQPSRQAHKPPRGLQKRLLKLPPKPRKLRRLPLTLPAKG